GGGGITSNPAIAFADDAQGGGFTRVVTQPSNNLIPNSQPETQGEWQKIQPTTVSDVVLDIGNGEMDFGNISTSVVNVQQAELISNSATDNFLDDLEEGDYTISFEKKKSSTDSRFYAEMALYFGSTKISSIRRNDNSGPQDEYERVNTTFSISS